MLGAPPSRRALLRARGLFYRVASGWGGAYESLGAADEARGWAAARWVPVDVNGYCEAAGEALGCLDLSPNGWEVLTKQVEQMASMREVQSVPPEDRPFARFKRWLSRNGPFDIVIDGANVAMFGPQAEGFAVRPEQIRAVWDHVAQAFPGRRALVVVHLSKDRAFRSLPRRDHRRPPHGAAPAAAGGAAAAKTGLVGWLDELLANRQYYVTGHRTNDDWYWLYACIAAQSNGLLISNDKLRDHVFEVGQHLFTRWKQQHQVRFSVRQLGGGRQEVALDPPVPFTACVQQLPGGGAWMLPAADRAAWLMVAPEQ